MEIEFCDGKSLSVPQLSTFDSYYDSARQNKKYDTIITDAEYMYTIDPTVGQSVHYKAKNTNSEERADQRHSRCTGYSFPWYLRMLRCQGQPIKPKIPIHRIAISASFTKPHVFHPTNAIRIRGGYEETYHRIPRREDDHLTGLVHFD